MKVYIVRATILFSICFGLKAADEPCLTANDSTTPFANLRSSEALNANKVICEDGGQNLIIQNYEALEDLRLSVRDRFCANFSLSSTHEGGSNSACDSENRYSFIQYGEHFDQFVTSLASNLQQYLPEVPSNYTNFSDDQVRALMLLCTEYQLKKYKRLLSSAATDADKEKIIDSLANLKLLTHFIHSDEGREFLADNGSSLEFRSKVIKKYLESAGANKELVIEFLDEVKYNIEDFTNADNLSDYDRATLEMSNVVMHALNQYLEKPSSEQSLVVLDMMAQVEIEGAQAALTEFQRASSPHSHPNVANQAPSGAGLTGGVGTQSVPPSFYPQCNEDYIQGFDREAYEKSQMQVSSILTNFSTSGVHRGLPPRPSFVDRWRWQEEIFNLEDSSYWQLLETRAATSPGAGGSVSQAPGLSNVRKYYCTHQKITSDFKRFEELKVSGENPSELANTIFNQINTLDAHGDFLSLLKELYPHLSDGNKTKVITEIKFENSPKDFEDIKSFKDWRFATFREWLTPYENDISDPIAREIVTAIAYDGLRREEDVLASLFRESSSEADREFILNLYHISSLTEGTGGDLKILSAISSETDQTKRDQYIRTLGIALGSFGTFSGPSENFAQDNGKVATLESVSAPLNQMMAMTSNPEILSYLQSQLDYRKLQAQGIVDPGVDYGTTRPIAKVPNDRITTVTSSSVTVVKPNSPLYKIGSPAKRKNSKSSKNFGMGSPYPLNNMANNIANDRAIIAAKTAAADNSQDRSNIFNDDQNNFFSNIDQIAGVPSSFTQKQKNVVPPLIPTNALVGENGVESTPTNSFDNSLARNSNSFKSNLPSPQDEEEASRSPSNQSSNSARKTSGNEKILNEIRQISRDTENLRREIDELDGPTQPLFPAPQVAQANQEADSQRPLQEAGTTRSQPINTSVNNQGNSIDTGSNIGSAQVANEYPVEGALEKQANPFSQGLLAPYDDPSKNDLSKIIKVTSAEEKTLLMNYMAANESMSCPELRFIQKFYDRNVNKFIMGKSRSEYALLDLDGMNFRFNYPGTATLRVKTQEACAILAENEVSKEVGQAKRAPASITPEVIEEENPATEALPEKTQPATRPAGIIIKFMLKLGL